MSEPTRNFTISNLPDLPKAIFNTEKSDYSEPSIILGEQPGILDSIHDHYPDLFEIYKRLRKLDWDEQEFDFSSCMVDFETCDKSTYDMMIKTLAWQWEADSMATRAISSILGPVITDSKVWAAYLRISENEAIHALTYSEIVRNSFKNPNVILDEILAVQEAQGRMYAVANVMDTAYHTSYAYALGQRENDESTYNDMFMFLVALYFLERIQFMASFSITFAICKTGWFQPIGHAVKKIAQDEFEIHAQYGQGVLRALMATPRGRKAYEQCKPKMLELFTEVLTIETEWIEYMFSEGRSLPGVNAKKIVDWTLFNANAARTFLGFKDSELTEFADNFTALTGDVLVWPTTNPLPYMEEYMDISASQSSPQEEKSKSDYQVNLMDSREEDDEFDFDM